VLWTKGGNCRPSNSEGKSTFTAESSLCRPVRTPSRGPARQGERGGRGRDTDRVLSNDNVDLVRCSFEAFLGPNPEAALEVFDADVEYDATDRPDGRVWHGRDAIQRAMIEWTGTWRNWSFEVERIVDLGDDRVLALWHESGEGKRSGIHMEQEGASLFTLRDGLIVRWVAYFGHARALEAAGLTGSQE
jgi:ketosteroid isomerase-like protein